MEQPKNFREGTKPAKHQFSNAKKQETKSTVDTFSAADYLKHLETYEPKPDLVNVTAPSGLVFEFQRPDSFRQSVLGEIPQSLSQEILDSWQAQGVTVYTAPAEIKSQEELNLELARKTYDATGQVLKLSRRPKLVFGASDIEKNELSIKAIPEEDLAYLVKWVMAGGSAIRMMAMFSEG